MNPTRLTPTAVTLVTSRSRPLATKLDLPRTPDYETLDYYRPLGFFISKRRPLIPFLIGAAKGARSRAQGVEQGGTDLPRSSPQGQHLWGREARSRNYVRRQSRVHNSDWWESRAHPGCG